ncbi:MAG: FecR family protein [Sphingobacterium hotanense]
METKKELLRKYVEGRATVQESALVEDWFNRLQSVEELTEDQLEELTSQLDRKVRGSKATTKSYWWIAAAAIVIIGSWLINYYDSNIQNRNAVYTEIAQIGAPKADGVEILFEDGQRLNLAKMQAGETWTAQGHHFQKIGAGEYRHSTAGNTQALLKFTIRALKGAMVMFDLSDGSKVWINERSDLEIPADFESLRKVRLEGEAYFKVIARTQHVQTSTFQVSGRDRTIEVLGTAFNAKFRAGSQVYLEEGKIRLSAHAKGSLPNQGAISMVPNEFFDGRIVRNMDDPKALLAWKDDQFYLTNFTLKEFASILSQWYQVQIEVAPELAERQLYGALDRRLSLEKVLESISKVQPIRFTLQDNKIYIR